MICPSRYRLEIRGWFFLLLKILFTFRATSKLVCWIWKLVIYAFKYYYNVNVSLLSAFIRIFDVNTPKNMGEYPFFLRLWRLHVSLMLALIQSQAIPFTSFLYSIFICVCMILISKRWNSKLCNSLW